MKTHNYSSTVESNPPPRELKQDLDSTQQERKWLKDNNAVTAVIDGPVEDLQGIPLPADLLDDPLPVAHSEKQS